VAYPFVAESAEIIEKITNTTTLEEIRSIFESRRVSGVDRKIVDTNRENGRRKRREIPPLKNISKIIAIVM
jgi:hypothetical protein